jgi:hypothetical protein
VAHAYAKFFLKFSPLFSYSSPIPPLFSLLLFYLFSYLLSYFIPLLIISIIDLLPASESTDRTDISLRTTSTYSQNTVPDPTDLSSITENALDGDLDPPTKKQRYRQSERQLPKLKGRTKAIAIKTS